MLALAIHPIVQRIEAKCDLIVHRWYADDGLLVGKIDQVKLALDIIAEYGARISFILQPSKTKAFWPTHNILLLKPLTKAYDLDLRPPSNGFKILGVPLRSPAFVANFIRKKMDAIDASLALAATIPDARIGHNIHRVTASACRMTHLLRLTPPAEAMALWRDFYGRQSAWFERI